MIVAWLLWGWLALAQGVYLLVAAYTPGPVPPWTETGFALGLGAVGLVVAGVALGLGRALPRWLLRRGTVRMAGPSALAPLALGLVAWCLAEAVSIYGLTVYFMTYRMLAMLPFTALAVVTFALTTPRAWKVAPLPSS